MHTTAALEVTGSMQLIWSTVDFESPQVAAGERGVWGVRGGK